MISSWIIVAIAAYFIMALSQLVDKAFLNVVFKEAKAYVFLVGALGSLVVILIPFGLTLPSLGLLLISLIGGGLFILALWPFLSALQGDDASRVIPLIGGVVPVATLIGEVTFLGGRLESLDYLAFALLVSGAIVLTFSRSESSRRSRSAAFKAVLGSLLFAASFVITKYVFSNLDFVSGFFWMRLGGVIAALGFFALPEVRQELKSFFTKRSGWLKTGYFANQGLAGGGFVLQNYAISLASVSLVNALQGVQYIFIIIFVVIAAKFKPELLGEKISRRIMLEKITAILIIVAGIAVLAL